MRRRVKSAVGEGGSRKANGTVGAPETWGWTNKQTWPQGWSGIFERFTNSALKTMMWKCQVPDLRAKPNIPFHSEVACLFRGQYLRDPNPHRKGKKH